MSDAVVYWLSGPVLKAKPDGVFRMKEAVTVGENNLVGEVIRLTEEGIVIQVFEDTTGMRPGVKVRGTGMALAVEFGPGLLGELYDGVQQPLQRIAQLSGNFIMPGATVNHIDREKSWHFTARVTQGEFVRAGHLLGDVEEGAGLTHRVLVPPEVQGECVFIAEPGSYRVTDTIAEIKGDGGEPHEVSMLRRWPIHQPRPFYRRKTSDQVLLTGQRIFDTLFPVGKGGAAMLPGGFGTGKTVLQQALAKWCDADVIIYIGCGERGNEMASILNEFPKLDDPRTGRRLLERTVVIANTSNMPVAAREASIYTGITLAEFFRDQGQHVALFADSISRWAEALREISARLEELPAEEGYPAYMPTRLAGFFERAGMVESLNREEGSITVIAAVSPPGGDFTEPVTSHAQRFVKSLWALDSERAQARFFPAIHPLISYSGYVDECAQWWIEHGGLKWPQRRQRILSLLEQQVSLERLVKIIGREALDAQQRLALFGAEMVSEALLRQSAFSPVDRFCLPEKQAAMLALIDRLLDLAHEAVDSGVDPDEFNRLAVIRNVQRMGEDIANDQLDQFDSLRDRLEKAFGELIHRERPVS